MKLFIYSIVITAVISLSWACSPERDEYSFPPMIYDEDAYLSEIKEADDLITLNVTRSNYAVALKKSEVVDLALEEKWKILTDRVESGGEIISRLCDEAELVAFEFEKVGPDRYRLYFLFRVIKQFSVKCGITLAGYLPDPELLPEPSREKGFMKWHFNPLPPTRFWQPGSYMVVSHEITAPNLPLELKMTLSTSEGSHGETVSLGVLGQIDLISLDPEKIMAESDPFQLRDWLQYCHARSGPTADMVRKRYREVKGELSPKGVIKDGIEYYGSKISRISPSRCRLQVLARATGPIESDYRIPIYGLVSPENMRYLSEPRRTAGKQEEKWSSKIFPRTSSWEEGEFIVITFDLDVAPISYELFAFLYDPVAKKAGPRFDLGRLEASE